MSDLERRRHERQAAQGDAEAGAKVLLDRLRRGDLSQHQLALAAYLGDTRAVALGDPCPPADLVEWVAGLAEFDATLPVNAAMALVLQAGYDPRDEERITAVEQWLVCPCRAHGLAAFNLWALPDDGSLIGQLLAGFVMTNPLTENVVLASAAALGEAETRGLIREALVPIALRPASQLVPWHFSKVSATLVHGDIAQREVDGIVNAANDRLLMQGGVAAALRAAGGPEIEAEAVRHAPAPLGSVVRTGAGSLSARFVYHASVIRYSLRGGTRTPDLQVALSDVVARARDDQLSTLAVPLLGAGVGGLRISESVESILGALESVREARLNSTSRVHVEVVVKDAEEYAEAAGAWRAFVPAAQREARTREDAEHYLRLLESGGAGFAGS